MPIESWDMRLELRWKDKAGNIVVGIVAKDFCSSLSTFTKRSLDSIYSPDSSKRNLTNNANLIMSRPFLKFFVFHFLYCVFQHVYRHFLLLSVCVCLWNIFLLSMQSFQSANLFLPFWPHPHGRFSLLSLKLGKNLLWYIFKALSTACITV